MSLMNWQLPPHAAEVMGMFSAYSGEDIAPTLGWVGLRDGSIALYAECSDTFALATADSERIEEEDMPLLRQCRNDLWALGRDAYWNLTVLFAARKRGIVPMKAWLDRESDAVRLLFGDIDEKELRVDVYTNGTGVVAVRITHIPTGIVVTEDRKEYAMKKMREALRSRMGVGE